MTENIDSPQTALQKDILAKADMCVYCGMCLPVCPTYQLSQQEAESPRGRLSLLTAYYQGNLSLDETLSSHLDHCLLCRSCESICPAAVPFANIMDSARSDMQQGMVNKSRLKRILLDLMAHKRRLRWLVSIMKFTFLDRLIKRVPVGQNKKLKLYLQLVQTMKRPPAWKSFYSGTGPIQDTVGLFLGCVHDYVDADSVAKTIKVLNTLGVNVLVPRQQQCCGAMHLHSGENRAANVLFAKSRHTFRQHKVTTVISLASACTVTLIEQEKNTLIENEEGGSLTFTDISTYLESIQWYDNRQLYAQDAKVLLHYPCTQKNVLKNTDAVSSMLQRIPGLEIREFKALSCCGAAGSYMLDNPEQSHQLKLKAAAQIEDDIDILVTSNVGCLMQFRSIDRKQQDISVIHPITIVARALRCE